MTVIEILRLPDVEKMVGLRKSQIYKMIGRDEFPRGVYLGKRAVGWRKADVQGWLAKRPAAQ